MQRWRSHSERIQRKRNLHNPTVLYTMNSMNICVSVVLLMAMAGTSQGASVGASQEATAAATNEFSLDLLRKVFVEGGNVFFSPLSISAAMAMASLGTRGNTLRELDAALHFNDVKRFSPDPMALHQSFQYIMELFQTGNKNYSLSIANRLFAQEGFEILSKFLEDTDKYYKSTVQSLDFGSGFAENIINRWVSDQTHGKIKELFKPASLKNAVLALVNAIYFKGNWKIKFNKEATKDMDFHMSFNDRKSVPMMKMKESFLYGEDADLKVQILEMPYAGNDLSMIVILPEQGELSGLVSKLTLQKLTLLLNQMRFENVMVKFPKFKLETEYSLKNTLQTLGINDLFSNSADLSGMSNDSLKVSEVVHKAFVETDEEGTEAAAATGITIVKMSLPIGKVRDPEFIADKPFFFMIVDKRLTNQILFTGILNRP